MTVGLQWLTGFCQFQELHTIKLIVIDKREMAIGVTSNGTMAISTSRVDSTTIALQPCSTGKTTVTVNVFLLYVHKAHSSYIPGAAFKQQHRSGQGG